MPKLLLFFLLLFGVSFTAVGQSSAAGELLMERLQEYGYTDEEVAIFMQHLETLRTTPLNLNTATSEDLAQLPFLDHFFIRNFLQYRTRNGLFSSIYDLKKVPGARVEQLSLLEPFLSAEAPERVEEQLVRAELFEFLSIPRYAHRQRLTFSKGKEWQASWNAERDAGEKWLPIKDGLWTHHNIFLSYTPSPSSSIPLRRFILGDYRVQTALGVMNGMGISFYNKQETGYRLAAPRRSEIMPHNSFQEWNYLRGTALTLTSGALSFTPYIGYTPLQVSLFPEGNRIRTIYKDGKQRPASRQIRLLTLGGYLKLTPSPDFHIGFQALNHRFILPSSKRMLYPPSAYPQELSPTRFAFDIAWRGSHTFIASEAVLPQRGISGSGALVAVLSYRQDYLGILSIVARHLGERFALPHTSTYGHFTSQNNEQGARLSWNGEVVNGWRGSLSADLYRSIKPSPRRASRTGAEAILRMEKGGPETATLLTLKLTRTDIGDKASFRARKELQIAKDHHLSTSFAYSYTGKKKHGWSIAGKLLGNIGTHWYYKGSLQYYDTPTWLQAVRSIESSSLLHYYSPMLYGKGINGALIVGYRSGKKLLLSLKSSYNHLFYSPTGQKTEPLIEIALKTIL